MVNSKLRSAVLLIGAVSSPLLAAPAFEPGQWEHHTTLVRAEVPGVPEFVIKLMAGHSSRTSCNSAAELNSHPETLFKADDTAICKMRNLNMSNGKIVFDTFCTNKHFPDGLLVSSHGSYTPSSYSLSTTSTGKKDGKPARILTTEAGKHVSDSCGKS